MRFKGFSLGKSKDKNDKKDAGTEGSATDQIAQMEEKINGRTKNLEKTAQKLKGLSGKGADLDVEAGAARPHGPIGELKLEDEEKGGGARAVPGAADAAEASGEPVKLVEVSAEKAPQAKDEKDKKAQASDSLKDLFGNAEEEANPLANLINSLPEVTAEELMEDLNEIKGIIKEWQQK